MQRKLYTATLGNGPPLVMLHGWGVHSSIWKFVAEKLAQKFQVILVDLPGFGRSHSIPSSYEIHTVVKQVLNVVPPEARWIGWSLGGLIAMQIAIDHPKKVKQLITVNSNPRFISDQKWPGVEIHLLHKFAEQLSFDYIATLKRFMMLQFQNASIDKLRMRWLLQEVFKYKNPQLDVLYNGLKLLEKLDLRPDIMRISCPALFMFGGLDRLVPQSTNKAINLLYPQIKTVVFPKANHAPFLSHEDEFLKQVFSFFV